MSTHNFDAISLKIWYWITLSLNGGQNLWLASDEYNVAKWWYVTFETRSQKSFSWHTILDCLFWGMPTTMSWEYPSYPLLKWMWRRPMCGEDEATCPHLAPTIQLFEWVILEADPPASVRPFMIAALVNTLTVISWGTLSQDCPEKPLLSSGNIGTISESPCLLFF